MTQILDLLDMPHLGLLLLTGDSNLTNKLQNGGVSSLRGVTILSVLNKVYFRDGLNVSHKHARVSFTPLFEKLKCLRSMRLDFINDLSRTVPTTLALMSQTLVSLWIKAPNALTPFVKLEEIDFDTKKELLTYHHICYAVKCFEIANPGKQLNLWVPISDILPSLRSLHIYPLIGQSWHEEDWQTPLKMLADFQRFLPHSLTSFGWNAHGGQRQELLDSLPPHIEVLEFEERIWMGSFDLDVVLKLPPNLTKLKYPYCDNLLHLSSTPLESLTMVVGRFETADDFQLPPTLTQMRAKISHSGELATPVIEALPPTLKRLRIEGGVSLSDLELLPPSLIHLKIVALDPLDPGLFAKLPQTLTHLSVSRIASVTFDFWNQLSTALPNLKALRFILQPGDYNYGINIYWELPPHLTRLECRYVRFSNFEPPTNFWALTHLHILDLELSERLLVQMPTKIVSVRVRTIKLAGFTTKDDSSLTHLSKSIILNHFQTWLDEQRARYGRVIFSAQVMIGEICALPQNLQTISRKLCPAPLAIRLPSLDGDQPAEISDPEGSLHVPPSMKSLNAFTFHLSHSDIFRLLEEMSRRGDVKSLVLPYQLVQAVGSY
jgi:hypothetical protein